MNIFETWTIFWTSFIFKQLLNLSVYCRYVYKTDTYNIPLKIAFGGAHFFFVYILSINISGLALHLLL